jgi:hypothetical protein
MIWSNTAYANVSATTPFTSHEVESGLLGGGATIVSLTSAPTTQYSSPELEASGHAYAQLTATGQSVTWTNTNSQNFTAINIRSCIPDAPAGGGIISTIDLYVNGVFRQAFSVNSHQMTFPVDPTSGSVFFLAHLYMDNHWSQDNVRPPCFEDL